MLFNAKYFLLTVVIASMMLTFAVVQSVPLNMGVGEANQRVAGQKLLSMNAGEAIQLSAGDELPSMDAGEANEPAVGEERRISLSCTIRCTSWWICTGLNMGRPLKCGNQPSGCRCNQFG